VRACEPHGPSHKPPNANVHPRPSREPPSTPQACVDYFKEWLIET
jgi:hypothetical protein